MSNIEKHPKNFMEQIDQADLSTVPTCARAAHLVGQYTKNRENGSRSRATILECRPRPVILRLEDLPATPLNLERMRRRIRQLNRRLEDSDTPFRLRLV